MSGVLQPGAEIAGYVIRSVIAKGGMGVVYLAHQDRPSRAVALKLITPERADDPAYRERFLRESELIAALEHPNIVPIHAAGEWEGQLYLAMRYIQGETLADRLLRDGPLAPRVAADILTPIADALTAAHEEGIVHRDVKPANILLSARGHVYLTDFGLTKRTGSDPGLTRPGTALGTEGYMAPEQFTGQVDPEFTTRIDVYALGCLLHACLTGVEPYPRDSYEASLWAHVFSPPPSLADRQPALTFLDPILARAMAKDPAERYPTANALISDLRTAIAAAPQHTALPPRDEAPAMQATVAPLEATALAIAPGPTRIADGQVPAPPGRHPLDTPTTVEPVPAGQATVIAQAAQMPTRIGTPTPDPPATTIATPGIRRPDTGFPRRTLVGVGVVSIAALVGMAWFVGMGGDDRERGGSTAPSAALSPVPSVSPRSAGPTESPPPTPTPTTVDPVSALIARVPPIAHDCEQVVGRSAAADVAIQCLADTEDGGVLNVQYTAFPDEATLQAAWATHLLKYEVTPGAGDCPATSGEHGWRLETDPDTIERGRQYCYVSQSDESVVEWTHVETSVWTVAWRPGIDLASLDGLVNSGALDLLRSGA